MIIKYKELISFSKKIELKSYNALMNQINSLVRGYNIKSDGSTFYNETIDKNLIELIPEDPQEETFIATGQDTEIASGVIGHTSNVNPSYNSNLFKGPGLGSWTNIRSGEFFICIDKTTDQNIWIGQLGTVIIPPNLTIDKVTSDGLLFHFPLDKTKGSKVHDSVSGYIATKVNTSIKNGMISKCLYFKGDSYIFLDSPEQFDVSRDFTFVYRVKPKTFDWRQHHVHISRHGDLSIVQETDGKISVYFGKDKDSYRKVTSIQPILLNQWNKIGIRRSGLSVDFIINGVPVGGTSTHFGNSLTELTSSANITKTNKTLYLGIGDLGSYKGYLDEIYLFKRILSNIEINLILDVGE